MTGSSISFGSMPDKWSLRIMVEDHRVQTSSLARTFSVSIVEVKSRWSAIQLSTSSAGYWTVEHPYSLTNSDPRVLTGVNGPAARELNVRPRSLDSTLPITLIALHKTTGGLGCVPTVLLGRHILPQCPNIQSGHSMVFRSSNRYPLPCPQNQEGFKGNILPFLLVGV